MYFLYKELGLTDEDFIQVLYFSLHTIKNSADINKTLLDKCTGKYRFIRLDWENWNLIKKKKHLFDCVFETRDKNTYYYNSEKTKMLWENRNRLGKEFRQTTDLVKVLYTEARENEVEVAYLNNIYVTDKQGNNARDVSGFFEVLIK